MVDNSSNCLKLFLNDRQRDFIRTESGWSDVSKCHVLTDGEISNRDGLVPDAVRVSDSDVAELFAESNVRTEQLQRIESLLREWIEIRKARSRRANQKQRLSLQKKEVV